MPDPFLFSRQGREMSVSAAMAVNVFLACQLAERDMGCGPVTLLGGSFSGESTRASLLLPEGEMDRWEEVLRRRLLQPEEDAYLERGALDGEPDFSLLGASSSTEDLRAWALAHYAASGITAEESLLTLRQAQKLTYQVLPISRFEAILADRGFPVMPVKVQAYARALQAGAVLPPLVVLLTGKIRLLEGFHRLHAHQKSNLHSLACVMVMPEG